MGAGTCHRMGRYGGRWLFLRFQQFGWNYWGYFCDAIQHLQISDFFFISFIFRNVLYYVRFRNIVEKNFLSYRNQSIDLHCIIKWQVSVWYEVLQKGISELTIIILLVKNLSLNNGPLSLRPIWQSSWKLIAVKINSRKMMLLKKNEKNNLCNFAKFLLSGYCDCGNKNNKFIQDQAFIDSESRNDKITKVHQIAATRWHDHHNRSLVKTFMRDS